MFLLVFCRHSRKVGLSMKIYDKYNFYKFDVPSLPTGDMGLSKRVESLLVSNGLTDSKSVAESYTVGSIYDIRGFGKKAAQEINLWIQANKNHSSAKEALS